MAYWKLLVPILIMNLALQQYANAQDWPNLKRYQAANEQLKDSTVKVVYMGDSITDFWMQYSPEFFTKGFVDRGINAQTTPQMLLRFRQDVIDLKPKAVVILAGTNDIAGLSGPSTLKMIEDNIQSMAELGKIHKIKVILCSLLPVTNAHGGRPADKIAALNNWIKDYAKSNHFTYVDYYSAMVDNQMNFKEAYNRDGLHPNKAGYSIMEELVQNAIKKSI